MNIQTLRDDPTAKELIHILFPNEIAQAEEKGEVRGIEKGIEISQRKLIKPTTERTRRTHQ